MFRAVDHAWTSKGEVPIMPIFTKCHLQPTPLLWVAVSESQYLSKKYTRIRNLLTVLEAIFDFCANVLLIRITQLFH